MARSKAFFFALSVDELITAPRCFVIFHKLVWPLSYRQEECNLAQQLAKWIFERLWTLKENS